MAIQRRVNWLSQERADVPSIRAIESAMSNDMDQLIQAFVTNSSNVGIGYVLRGFEILMTGAIGGAASGLLLQVDPGALFHIDASQSGTVMMVPTGTPNQQLNGATNPMVTGGFTPNSINYIGIDYTRFIDSTTDAESYFWDPTSNSETTSIVPQAIILTFTINISSSTWPANILPIATVVTDAGNNVLSVTDARWGLFRLGQGGADPNPFYVYPWTADSAGRTENPSTSSSDSVSPFLGGDKMLYCLKDWMNAVMSQLLEIQGTTFWYSPVTGTGSLVNLREDLGSTVVTGAGVISNGVLPNTTPVLTTTGTITATSNQLTALASTVGIAIGQYIMASSGIPSLTTVLSISGSTVTMSQNATLNTTESVAFWDPATVTAPGQVNWDKGIFLDVIGSSLSYEILPNPTSAFISLSNDEAAYITLIRNQPVAPNLIFTNGSQIVQSVGSVVWTTNLLAGDYIRLVSDTDAGYYEIQSVDSGSQVHLTTPWSETSTGASGAKAVYAFGSYQAVASPSGNPRAIQVSTRETVPSNGNVWWLFLREDNSGSVATVYVRFIGQELENGDTNAIDSGFPKQVLEYIGSSSEYTYLPQYVSALNPGSIPEITGITVGAASTMASNEYFYMYSSGNYRAYYIWVNKDGTGVDPMPTFPIRGLSLEWVVTTGQTSTQTAATLAVLLGGTSFQDFTATSGVGTVTVTNNSAGISNPATNFNVGAPFAVTVTQAGTGTGNYSFQDGDNLTLAIKDLDIVVGSIATSLTYDETVTIVASGATPPGSLNGPISPGTLITLPNNSRGGGSPVEYIVEGGRLEVFLNGQKLIVGNDYAEFGTPGQPSNQIETLETLVVFDELEFTFGGGGQGGGEQGPQGPPGATGTAGTDAAGGPVNVSTKTTSYTVMPGDNVLLANCTGGPITFTLPTPAGNTGHVYYCKKIDSSSNAMAINVTGGANIDGSATQTTIVQWTAFTLVTDGTSYYIL